jgi:hydroxyacylglutathione hydrolase
MSVSLRILPVISQPFEEVTYIVHQPEQPDCFVVDPGFQPELLLQRIEREELEVAAILNTHGHVDHIAGNSALKARFPSAPLIVGANEAKLLLDPFLNLSALGGEAIVSPPADLLVHDGQQLQVIGLTLTVREIPGHSPGHVAFIWNDGDPPLVFGGDVLFAGSVGRVDFPGGDGKLLIRGIREKLYTLPDETIVYPGHGSPTTIGDEKQFNPFTSGQVLF